MSDRLEVYVYTINRWDCPECGEVMEGDADLTGDDKCDYCGTEVTVL